MALSPAAGSAWQTECSEVRQRTARMLASGQWADCWFAVGAQGERRAAHRWMLALASPVMEAMLLGTLAEGAEPIAVPDMEPEAFDVMLKYIYTDEVRLPSCRVAQGVFYGADKYQLPHLRAACEAYLADNLRPDTACGSYEHAELFDGHKLRNACLQMMRERTTEVLEADSWVEAREKTVALLFSLEPLNIQSELQLVAAAARRAAASPTEAGASQMPLRSAVRHIRFLTLTAQEFSDSAEVDTFLTESETLAILRGISSQQPKTMPSGLSSSRISRVRTQHAARTRTHNNTQSAPAMIQPLPFNNGVLDKGRAEATVHWEVHVKDITPKWLDSPIFYARHMLWNICVRRDTGTNDLKIRFWYENEVNYLMPLRATGELTILPHKAGVEPLIEKWYKIDFRTQDLVGMPWHWNGVMYPAAGYVHNNHITFKVHLLFQD